MAESFSQPLKQNETLSPINPTIHSETTYVLEPARGWSGLKLYELWEYRDLLYFMIVRDLKTRYRQTALGPLWIVINPLFSVIIYSFIFGLVAKLPSGNVPYAVFTYTALIVWDFFASAFGSGTSSLFNNRQLISKVYFPRLLLPFSRITSSLIDFLISLVILLAMIIIFRITPTIGVLFIPLFLLIASITGLGVGLLFSGLIVKYRDFGNVTGYILRFWMYATPVVYSSEIVPADLKTLYQLNPMTNVVDGFRWALLGQPPPDWTMTAVSSALAFTVFVTSLFIYKRVERNIVDIA